MQEFLNIPKWLVGDSAFAKADIKPSQQYLQALSLSNDSINRTGIAPASDEYRGKGA